MRRVELIQDITIVVVAVLVFGTVLFMTSTVKPIPQQATIVYAASSVQSNTAQEQTPIVQSVATHAPLRNVEEQPSSSTTPVLEDEDHKSAQEATEEVVIPKEEPKAVITETKKVEVPKQSVVVPAVEYTSSKGFKQELISLIQAQTNAFRKKNGLPPLQLDAALAQQALSHSTDMLIEDFFSHTNTSGCDFTCRFNASGYDARAWGENLAQYTFSDFPTAQEVANNFMSGWQKSAGHRENLLGESFTYQGIGVAMDDETIYVTVDFAEPL
jgi:uncharacterized protein YkwD